MPQIQSLISGRPVVSLPANTTVFDAVLTMTAQNVGALLVSGADLRPQGIFSERDLMRRVVAPGLDPRQVTLGEVMTRELYTAERSSLIATVRKALQERHIRHVPVLDGGVAIAILGLRDLLRADLEQCSSELLETKLYIQGETELG